MLSNRVYPLRFEKQGRLSHSSEWLFKIYSAIKLLNSDVKYSPEYMKQQMKRNRFFPFQGEDVDFGIAGSRRPRLILEVTCHQLYQAMALAIPSAITIFSLSLTGNISTPLFIYPVFILLSCVMFASYYRHNRVFQINHEIGTYKFSIAKDSYVGKLNNLYIRLSQNATKSGELEYHIVLDGRGVIRYNITTRSTDIHEMRRLGKQIAGNLLLNYFDESNISPYHIVRHTPPTENQEASKAGKAMHMFRLSPSKYVLEQSKLSANHFMRGLEESDDSSESSAEDEEFETTMDDQFRG